MKVYRCPDEVPAPEVDYSNYDHQKVLRDEEKHQLDLTNWLKSNGYNGPRTGEIYREQIHDGFALYMVGDGRRACLIHLPYGDAYQSRDIHFVPKAEVYRRIDAAKKWQAMFAKSA